MVSHTPKYTPRQYLEGIRLDDSIVIKSIVEEYFPGIRRHITRNNGTEQDAEDNFQDALEVVFRKTTEQGLRDLTCTFYTYLFEICKRLWLVKLRKENPDLEVTLEDWMLLIGDEDPQEALENTERHRLFWEKFELLDEDCRKVLNLSLLEKKRAEEIADLLGYGSAGYVRKKRYECKKAWKAYIESDPRFRELKF